MKRRKWLQSVITAPALAASTASPQASAQQPAATPVARSVDDAPKLPLASPEQVSDAGKRFLSDLQRSTLTALCAQVLPAKNGRPGAVDAGVPDFLDFLLSQSPAARQTLYRSGLDRLNAEARRRFQKDFASIAPTDAAPLLAPLENPWKFEASGNAAEEFLKATKEDIFQATINSRAWADSLSGRSRAASGMGQYYFTIE